MAKCSRRDSSVSSQTLPSANELQLTLLPVMFRYLTNGHIKGKLLLASQKV